MKTCTRCKTPKPLGEFNTVADTRGKRTCYCKGCIAIVGKLALMEARSRTSLESMYRRLAGRGM